MMSYNLLVPKKCVSLCCDSLLRLSVAGMENAAGDDAHQDFVRADRGGGLHGCRVNLSRLAYPYTLLPQGRD